IRARHEVVTYLTQNSGVLGEIQQQIKQISDLERLISKIAAGKVSPREVIYLKDSLDAIVPIKELALKSDNEALKAIGDSLHSCDLLREKIKTTVHPEAPVSINKGNAIAKGVHPELDELRSIAYSGKEYVEGIERRESGRTGMNAHNIAI